MRNSINEIVLNIRFTEDGKLLEQKHVQWTTVGEEAPLATTVLRRDFL